MRLPIKFGLPMATILAASFGYASLAQAAPLAGVAAAVPSVQMRQNPLAAEALPEKAYHYGYKHRKYYKPIYKKHHGYKKHYGYKKPPSYPPPSYPPKEEYPK
jgi:hypothetical protein